MRKWLGYLSSWGVARRSSREARWVAFRENVVALPARNTILAAAIMSPGEQCYLSSPGGCSRPTGDQPPRVGASFLGGGQAELAKPILTAIVEYHESRTNYQGVNAYAQQDNPGGDERADQERALFRLSVSVDVGLL